MLSRSDLKNIRLGFVSDRNISIASNQLWADAATGRLVNALKESFKELHLALSVYSERTQWAEELLKVPAANLRPLPKQTNFVNGVLNTFQVFKILKTLEPQIDAFIIQMPFPAFPALSCLKKPILYHLCSDITAVTRFSPRYGGWKRGLITGLTRFVSHQMNELFKKENARILTNGEALLKNLKAVKGRSVISSTLYKGEMLTEKELKDENFHPRTILYAGRLSPEKGIFILLETFLRLLRVYPDLKLHIVGSELTQKIGLKKQMLREIQKKPLRGKVIFEGYKPFGPELFTCYKNADIFVLPSFSEGTPRTLIEARAFGCPVVATNVGGIPSSISHEVDGLLIPPGDVTALEEAILRVFQDNSLRHHLIRNGLQRVQNHSFERFYENMIEEFCYLPEIYPS